jgi:SAM-dependent methyltransferase
MLSLSLRPTLVLATLAAFSAPVLAQHEGHDHGKAKDGAAQKAPEAPAKEADQPRQPVPSTMITDPNIHIIEHLRRDAALVMPTIQSPSVRQFLFNTNWLTYMEETRAVYYNKATRDAKTPDEFNALAKEQREGFELVNLDQKFYYHTRYGSPHAYARAFDLVCQAASADGTCFGQGKRVFDFGCGGIVQLRLLASSGMHAVGVDVDPLLKAFFRNPEDVGVVRGADENVTGSMQVEYGSWPGDAKVKNAVGGNFDFIISKNTLKKGYIHPAKPVDERMLVKLGVSDEVFIKELFGALKPGGFVIIYNICPAQNPEKYIPWADGTSPFTREQWEKAGFSVVAFDKEDQDGVKALAKALGWNVGESPMDIEKDLFAWYTIVQRPTAEKKTSEGSDAKTKQATPAVKK